jgi:hypothetical protein
MVPANTANITRMTTAERFVGGVQREGGLTRSGEAVKTAGALLLAE